MLGYIKPIPRRVCTVFVSRQRNTDHRVNRQIMEISDKDVIGQAINRTHLFWLNQILLQYLPILQMKTHSQMRMQKEDLLEKSKDVRRYQRQTLVEFD